MWGSVVVSLLYLISMGLGLRGIHNETQPVQRLTAIKPWYRNAAEKERAVLMGAGMNVTRV
jgi:hypothetical protein